MLLALSIRDVVLIERLDLTLTRGLNALTGETGAGKSILLDALGLALGNRGEAGLVRHGATQASVTAEFDIVRTPAVHDMLQTQDIDAGDGTLILRRSITADGRSRAFINDQPCGLGTLKNIAGLLVETHGQFETGALLNRDTHRATLDAFGQLEKLVLPVAEAFHAWRQAFAAKSEAAALQHRAAEEEAHLRDAVQHLDELAPHEGEDAELEQARQKLANRDRIATGLTSAETEITGAETALNAARRALDRIAAQAGPRLVPAQEALARAAMEVAEAADAIARLGDEDDAEGRSLESVDDRLFALRNAARRHGVEIPALAAYHAEISCRLDTLGEGDDLLARLAREEAVLKASYIEACDRLTAARTETARRFDRVIAGELAPLKLDRARVVTEIAAVDETGWSATGRDRVTFLVAMNPGAPPGPLNKVASGGELARFMLALKVVLAGVAATPVMVFDEVDSGIGGATADAVGERLKRLGHDIQLLVVTHSPQVAARADSQWRVEKRTSGTKVVTDVVRLDDTQRREEIARMLSGATITDEARAAAEKLLCA